VAIQFWFERRCWCHDDPNRDIGMPQEGQESKKLATNIKEIQAEC
jgi:hypothetical protein